MPCAQNRSCDIFQVTVRFPWAEPRLLRPPRAPFDCHTRVGGAALFRWMRTPGLRVAPGRVPGPRCREPTGLSDLRELPSSRASGVPA